MGGPAAALALAGVALLAVLLLWRQPRPPGGDAATLQGDMTVAQTAAPAVATARPLAGTPYGTEPPPGLNAILEQVPAAPGPQPVLHSWRLTYEPGMYAPEIQAVLDAYPGPLSRVRLQVGDQSLTFSEALAGRSILSSVSPRVILALAELQSGLLTSASPGPEALTWAFGYRGETGRFSGIAAQLRWVVRELHHAQRDFPARPDLTFADGSTAPIPADMQLGGYALARVLAQTTTPDQLAGRLAAFEAIYQTLFDEEPGSAPQGWPQPATPFLSRPMERPFRITSFFDHDAPFIVANGSLVSYWGRREQALSYDGHDGWDYAMMPPDRVLAAADGRVVFAGNSDDGCATPARAVAVDHGNGYRTLYWHLHRIAVQPGEQVVRGQVLGVAGASGCATGPHLHFQVQYLGRDTDPYGWCASTPDDWAQHPAGTISVWLWRDRPAPCAAPPAGAILVDTGTPGFSRSGAWQPAAPGYGGDALFATALQGMDPSQPWEIQPLATPAIAVWQPQLPAEGRYRVLVYVPYALNGLDDAVQVRYRIRHADGESEVLVDTERLANDWAELGSFRFDPQQSPLVSISSLSAEAGRSVWADAVLFVPEP